MEQKRICPLCGKVYFGAPALSRRDNMTAICPDCGTKEALADYAKGCMKKQYTVCIEETVVQNFTVEAGSSEEALDIARARYDSAEFIITSGEVEELRFAVIAPEDEKTEFE